MPRAFYLLSLNSQNAYSAVKLKLCIIISTGLLLTGAVPWNNHKFMWICIARVLIEFGGLLQVADVI